ncbi:CARDB domain-containing protein [Herbidospora sp. RD11066]
MSEPIHRGGYARVPVDLGGLAWDDVTFAIAEGPRYAALSESADAGRARSEVMLLAGPHPGSYTLEVRDPGGAVLAAAPFTITEEPPAADGPPMAFTGANPMYPVSGAWGSVLNTLLPTTFRLGPTPVSGTRRVAIVYVNTADTTLPPGTRSTYRAALAGGVTGRDGVVRSVRDYFREVSRGELDVVPAGESTVTVPRTWGGYHVSVDGTMRAGHDLIADALWRAQHDIDFTKVDTCVVVVASPGGGLFSWPIASGGTFALSAPLGWWWKSLPWVVMPADWESVNARRAFQTLTHEIGHTIGLGDMYSDDPRALGDWDVMANEGAYSALTLPHSLALGWTDPSWLRRYDFLVERPVDEEVVLTAAELLRGGPQPGERAGLEIEVADGWRYYFEYRSSQDADLADQNMPADRVVLGTDVVAGWYHPPVARRPIRLLPDDGDGDSKGAALPVGADYEEPDAGASFRVQVLAADDDRARVRVTYQPVPAVVAWPDGPDPSIRPWATDYRSPDIAVTNATGLPIPWAGHDNTITATVRNTGGRDASKVRVGFWVKDFTVSSSGPETFLGWDVADVPAGGTRDFHTVWRPPARGFSIVPLSFVHYCVVVRIAPHQGEVSAANNEAQSNYTIVWTAAASPYDRRTVPVTVTNPYDDRPVRVNLHAEQTLDWCRTYLEHRWVMLAPGETRPVEVMVECVAREPAFADRVREAEVWRTPNTVKVIATIDDPGSDVPVPAGGGTIEVRAGLATGLTELDVSRTSASGRLTTASGAPVAGATVLITCRDVERLTTGADGRFSATLRTPPTEITYPGDLVGYAPCATRVTVA